MWVNTKTNKNSNTNVVKYERESQLFVYTQKINLNIFVEKIDILNT